jgi:hypothetical protein
LANAESVCVVRYFLVSHSGIWFRVLPRHLARLAAARAVRKLQRYAHRAQAEARVRAECQSLLDAMLARAAIGTNGKPWSRKFLVFKAGLTWGTFNRALTGELDLKVWLPRLRAAAERLGT